MAFGALAEDAFGRADQIVLLVQQAHEPLARGHELQRPLALFVVADRVLHRLGLALQRRPGAETLDPSRHETVVEVKGATYTALRVAQDGAGRWTAQTVVDDHRPAAVREAGGGRTAMLDGSRSTSSDGSALSYAWSFVSKPDGSAAQLTGADTAHETDETDETA